jgi:hypothetical protein
VPVIPTKTGSIKLESHKLGHSRQEKKKQDPISKISEEKKAESMAQALETCLASMKA